jgi:predicted phage-related endonuclease
MKTLDLIQGSPEWLAHRATAKNASEAAAVLGCSPYMTREQLLQVMHTGLRPEPTPEQQRRFDKGHDVEAAKRPTAEAIIGEDLYPAVGSEVVDGIELSASFDGLTMLEDTNWECKSLNNELRSALPNPGPDGNDARLLSKYYRAQMQQQCMVAGCSRVLFTTSDGKGDDRHCWFYPDAALAAEIIAGWKQFAIDLAAYKPTEVAEMPKAEVTIALPALFIHAKGEITTSNMKEYGEALAARLKEIRAIKLVDDQDFSNAKESAKMLRENREKALLAKDAMLAQTVTVGEAANMIDAWAEDMRLTALQLEKDVEREDKAKKAAMIDAAKVKYTQHVDALNTELSPARLTVTPPAFAEAIKNKRNFASMQDAINTMLANAKIAADEQARGIRAALACLAEEGKDFEFLLADRLTLIGKPVEDLRTLIRARITEHKATEERKEAATRERIRAEEQAKAEKDARDKLAAEQAEAEAKRQLDERLATAQQREDARQAEIAHAVLLTRQRKEAEHAAGAAAMNSIAEARKADALPGPVLDALETAASGLIADLVIGRAASPPTVVPIRAAAPATQPTLKLGEINARLHPYLKTDEAGLAALGFPATKVKGACLYQDSEFPSMVDSMVAALRTVQAKQRQAA